MAELIGVVSGVGSLVGLAGQLFNGCLFVKSFLDDTKNAPDDIRALHTEFEILTSSAEETNKLVAACLGMGPDFDVRNYQRALQQYVSAVEKLGENIAEDARKFGLDGKGKWWERMKSAGKKKSLNAHMVRIERAKTQVMSIEQKLIL